MSLQRFCCTFLFTALTATFMLHFRAYYDRMFALGGNHMNKLRELRIAKGITQERLSEETGVSRAMLYYLETNKRPMRIQHAEVLAPYFGVSVDYIMGSDAIYFAGTFKDALRNLIDGMFDDMVTASVNNNLDEYSRLLYALVQKVLDLGTGIIDLIAINAYVDELIKKHHGGK
jgi:transcriptional regulator with XRE-family HTH domain